MEPDGTEEIAVEVQYFTDKYLGKFASLAITGPHTRRAKDGAPAVKYYKVRSSVFDSNGREIKDSIAKEVVETIDLEVAKEAGFKTAKRWAYTSF